MLVQYAVGSDLVVNAVEAWQQASARSIVPLLQMPKGFYDYDWTMEPEKSIEALEDDYVKALYAKNKDLRVIYSGGTDSHSIATALARNKIQAKFTFIIFSIMHKEILDSKFWINAKVARLVELYTSRGLPAPEYELIFMEKDKIEGHFVKEFYLKNAFYNSNQTFNLNFISGALRHSRWNPATTTNIYGIEKPRLYEDKGGIYWQITDTMSMYCMNTEHEATWFYCSEDALDLVAKQCWAVIRHCMLTYPKFTFGHSSKLLQTTPEHYYEWCKALGRNTDEWWANMSRYGKPFAVKTKTGDDHRYFHEKDARADSNPALQNFKELYNVLEEITGHAKITSVLTDKFYLLKTTPTE